MSVWDWKVRETITLCSRYYTIRSLRSLPHRGRFCCEVAEWAPALCDSRSFTSRGGICVCVGCGDVLHGIKIMVLCFSCRRLWVYDVCWGFDFLINFRDLFYMASTRIYGLCWHVFSECRCCLGLSTASLLPTHTQELIFLPGNRSEEFVWQICIQL